jgi:hypothetical protein
MKAPTLLAVARHRRTGSSNPVPSSGESDANLIFEPDPLPPVTHLTPRGVVPAAQCGKRPVSGLKLFWRVVDWLDYRIMDVRLHIVDVVYGPEPETRRHGDETARSQNGTVSRVCGVGVRCRASVYYLSST